MLSKIKERIPEVLFSPQLWIGTTGFLFIILKVFLDLIFIKLQIIQPELKHLILIDALGILLSASAMLVPGFFASSFYEIRAGKWYQKNMTERHKKQIRFNAVKREIKIRRVLNIVFFPFFILLNPFAMQRLIKEQYLEMVQIIFIGIIIWMTWDYIFYRKLYLKYFKIKNIKNQFWHTIKCNFKINLKAFRIGVLLINVFTFIVILQDSVLLKNTFSTSDDLLFGLAFELAFLSPSLIIMYFQGYKRWIYGFICGAFSCCLLIAHVKEIFTPWLSKHHISGFEDYKFILKKDACEDLEFNQIKLIKSKDQTCKIATKYKVLNIEGDYYKIKIENHDRAPSIEYVKKKNIRHIHEVSYEYPKQRDLDGIVKLFSSFYNIPLLVAIHHGQKVVLQSQSNIKENNITFSAQKDKAVFLAANLDHMGSLVNLMDDASYINPSFQGSIIEALKNDPNNQFYFSFIDKIAALSDTPIKKPFKIEKILPYLHAIEKNSTYVKYFNELGYWYVKESNQGKIIELHHQEPNMKMLSLYIKAQDVALIIVSNAPDLDLTTDNPRVKNLIEAILNP